MTPMDHTLIAGVVTIAGFYWVKAASTFTTGLFRTGTVLLILALLIGAWF